MIITVVVVVVVVVCVVVLLPVQVDSMSPVVDAYCYGDGDDDGGDKYNDNEMLIYTTPYSMECMVI